MNIPGAYICGLSPKGRRRDNEPDVRFLFVPKAQLVGGANPVVRATHYSEVNYLQSTGQVFTVLWRHVLIHFEDSHTQVLEEQMPKLWMWADDVEHFAMQSKFYPVNPRPEGDYELLKTLCTKYQIEVRQR